MNNDEIEEQIIAKKQAIRSEAFTAKQDYEQAKNSYDDMDIEDYDDFPELKELRHDMKFLMALLSASKFDEIIHLLSNPMRLTGINFVIGFVRGLGVALALLIIGVVVFVSLSDSSLLALYYNVNK